jgi:hypothetical protein
MLIRIQNRIVQPLLIAFFIALIGCGSSGNQPVPPPSGTFSNSNLNGTYVVSFSGYDISNGYGSFFALLGSITANGNGGFTSGTIDIDDPALGSALGTSYVFTHLATSGTYNITSDGRGTGNISVSINGASVEFRLDFVMMSRSHGLISRFDQNASGSGSIDLQSVSLPQSSLAGSYAFGFNGVDSSVVNSLSTVGAFTLDNNGNVTAGQQDFNDNGSSRGLKNLSVNGTVLAGIPGSSQLTTNAFGFGTLHFDVWAIDSTHLKFIETDSRAYIEGDALASTGHTSLPYGSLVLTLSGEDVVAGPFAAGGLLTSDGASQITSGLEDVNDEGIVAQAPSVSGSFTSSGARSTLILNGLYNGNIFGNTLSAGSYTFAAYPYNGGAFLLEVDNGAGSTYGISGGNLYVQSATSIGTSQGYGLNLSGVNGNGEVDSIAEFTTSGSVMNGLYDTNNLGYLVSDASLGTGTYSLNSNGRGTASFPSLQTNGNSFIPALNLTFYVLDNSTVVFLETDATQLSIGSFQLQTASSGSSVTPSSDTVRPRVTISPPISAMRRVRLSLPGK